MRGIIDELRMDEAGALKIVEWKTRRRNTLPFAAQQRAAGLQLHLYRKLWMGLRRALTGAQLVQLGYSC